MEIVHRPGASHQNSDALSRRPCEREEEEVACRQCHHIGKENGNRTVRVMTRRQRPITGKPEKNTKRVRECEIDLSLAAMREAQRSDGCLKAILELLDAEPEKPPWSAVEGADSEIQQLYAQWEALQLHDGVLYRNFINTDGRVRWKQLLVPRSLRAALLQHLYAGPTAGHMRVMKTQDRVKRMAY